MRIFKLKLMLCSRPILTIPAGPGWLHPTNAISGRRTHACIRGTNNSGLSQRGIAVNGSYSGNFSPPIASNYQPSLFDNADYGIDIQAMDLDVRDARFQNIYCNGGFSNPCPIPYPGFSELPTAIRTNANNAQLHALKNKFFACTNGIYAIRSSRVVIENNDFPNNLASAQLANIQRNIHIFDMNQGVGTIRSNTIRLGEFGIALIRNRLSKILVTANKFHNTRMGVATLLNTVSDLTIVSNWIDTRPFWPVVPGNIFDGVHIHELGLNSALVRNNRMWSKNNGVFLISAPGLFPNTPNFNFTPNVNNVQISHNGIYMGWNRQWGDAFSGIGPGFPNFGIRSIGAITPNIKQNGMSGPSVYAGNTITNRMTGIEVWHNVNPIVHCNSMALDEDNIVIKGVNFPGEVRRNTLNKGRTGIMGLDGTIMQAQLMGNPNITTENIFECPFTFSSVRAVNALNFFMTIFNFNSSIELKSNPNQAGCGSTVPSPPNCFGGTGCIDQPANSVSDKSPLDLCPVLRLSEEGEDDGELEVYPEPIITSQGVNYFHSLVDSLIDSMSIYDAFYTRLYLYRYLSLQDSLRASDSLLNTWWEGLQTTVFERMQGIEVSISETDLFRADSLLNNWEPEDSLETAWKRIYQVYTRLSSDSVFQLNSVEKADLRAIALTCPGSLGNPVYIARSLLMVLDTFTGISVCEWDVYMNQDSLSGDSTGGSPSFAELKVYPNPADISVTLEHTFDPGEGYSIEVINLLGNMVYSYNYEESELEVEWDTSSQIQGMYYVFLYREGVLLDYKLLSILH
jgi:hypothetical protein